MCRVAAAASPACEGTLISVCTHSPAAAAAAAAAQIDLSALTRNNQECQLRRPGQ